MTFISNQNNPLKPVNIYILIIISCIFKWHYILINIYSIFLSTLLVLKNRIFMERLVKTDTSTTKNLWVGKPIYCVTRHFMISALWQFLKSLEHDEIYVCKWLVAAENCSRPCMYYKNGWKSGEDQRSWKTRSKTMVRWHIWFWTDISISTSVDSHICSVSNIWIFTGNITE